MCLRSRRIICNLSFLTIALVIIGPDITGGFFIQSIEKRTICPVRTKRRINQNGLCEKTVHEDPEPSNQPSGDELVTVSASSPSQVQPRNLKNDIQTTIQTTATRVSNTLEKRATDVQSAAKAASSGLASAAGGTADAAKRLTTSFQTNAQTLANRSRIDLKLGSHRVRKIAKRSALDLSGLAEKGGSDLGQVAQWIDAQAKFGTRTMSSKAKSLVLNFTGKEKYKFGDITKELIRRIASREVTIQDTILVIKVLIAIGASFAPFAKTLPFAVLLNALNVSLEQKVGAEVLNALALALDERLVAAFTSDDKFRIGDAVKQSLLTGILAFTGKEKYEKGDIQHKVAEQVRENESEGNEEEDNSHLDLRLDSEFEEWDKIFVEACSSSENNDLCPADAESLFMENGDEDAAKIMDMKIALALEECEVISQSQSKGFFIKW
mmetsp:Transcript_18083/g.37480  ORF Transcript_18083/g.37480 Transcript_18083/m.37480 type:complete len:438 (+) Transcript_18083:54-1367(+)